LLSSFSIRASPSRGGVCLLHEAPITIAGIACLSFDELAENRDYSHAGSANTGVGYWPN
jgi:hypothetical protein